MSADQRSLTEILAELQQAVADGELVMAPTTGTELREAQRRIEQLELLLRTVRSFGIGYLLQHGTEQLVLKPSDVTIVLAADQPATDLDQRARIAELEAQRDQVLALAAAAKIGMTQHCWCPEGDDGALKHSPYCKGPQSYWDLDPAAIQAVYGTSSVPQSTQEAQR